MLPCSWLDLTPLIRVSDIFTGEFLYPTRKSRSFAEPSAAAAGIGEDYVAMESPIQLMDAFVDDLNLGEAGLGYLSNASTAL